MTLIYHNPNEVMRLPGILLQKKVKKVRDINLTSKGFGKVDIGGTFEALARV